MIPRLHVRRDEVVGVVLIGAWTETHGVTVRGRYIPREELRATAATPAEDRRRNKEQGEI